MVDVSINDLPAAASVQDNMQFEVDTGGSTANKVTGAQLKEYVTDNNAVKSDETANFTAGFTATTYNAGTKSSGTFTPNPAQGNLQRVVNGGAHTLNPPAN